MGKLDQLLAVYDPIDKDAYRRLQHRTRDFGYLETELVQEWLGFERYAVEVTAGWRTVEPEDFSARRSDFQRE